MEQLTVFADLPTLETPRLTLRKLQWDDAADVFEYASDLMVSQYTLWATHRSLEDTYRFLDGASDQYRNLQPSSWGIVHRGDRKVIGTCGFTGWHSQNARIEVGYALSRSYWGQGYMTEAVQKVLDWSFELLPLNRIAAMSLVENIASQRVLEKVGMTFEGKLRDYLCIKGKYCDVKVYSILKSDWQARTA